MGNRYTKQVLVVRKDLNMRKGKIAAQCAHASLKILTDQREVNSSDNDFTIFELWSRFPKLWEWLEDGYQTKVVVCVNSEEELLEVYKKAQDKGLLSSIVTDLGLTEFKGVPTKTVVAVGPADVEDFVGITDGLKLM